VLQVLLTREVHRAVQRQLEEWPAGEGFAERDLWNSRQRGASLAGTPHALYSKPFAFRTVWAAGEERNVTSALPASV
jgi:hypothetical protein